MRDKEKTQTHECKGEHPFTVENRGDGWYLYMGGIRGMTPIHFCPYCGEKLK